ncbi:MAG: hypothetical protein OXE87_16615 [Chloroflexi bacterium]|nr:hypothetical protein [Chloroflexota bacterium]
MLLDLSGLYNGIMVLLGIIFVGITIFTLLWAFSSDHVRALRALGVGVGMAILTVVSLALWLWLCLDYLAYRGGGPVVWLIGIIGIIGLGIWLSVIFVRWVGRKPAAQVDHDTM